MTTPTDPQPAFPSAVDVLTYRGLYIRDWFAGWAASGLVNKPGTPVPATIAQQAYAIADAMMKERSK